MFEVMVREPKSKWEQWACREEKSLIQWQIDDVVTALFPNGSVWRTEFVNGEWLTSTIHEPKVES